MLLLPAIDPSCIQAIQKFTYVRTIENYHKKAEIALNDKTFLNVAVVNESDIGVSFDDQTKKISDLDFGLQSSFFTLLSSLRKDLSVNNIPVSLSEFFKRELQETNVVVGSFKFLDEDLTFIDFKNKDGERLRFLFRTESYTKVGVAKGYEYHFFDMQIIDRLFDQDKITAKIKSDYYNDDAWSKPFKSEQLKNTSATTYSKLSDLDKKRIRRFLLQDGSLSHWLPTTISVANESTVKKSTYEIRGVDYDVLEFSHSGHKAGTNLSSKSEIVFYAQGSQRIMGKHDKRFGISPYSISNFHKVFIDKQFNPSHGQKKIYEGSYDGLSERLKVQVQNVANQEVGTKGISNIILYEVQHDGKKFVSVEIFYKRRNYENYLFSPTDLKAVGKLALNDSSDYWFIRLDDQYLNLFDNSIKWYKDPYELSKVSEGVKYGELTEDHKKAIYGMYKIINHTAVGFLNTREFSVTTYTLTVKGKQYELTFWDKQLGRLGVIYDPKTQEVVGGASSKEEIYFFKESVYKN